MANQAGPADHVASPNSSDELQHSSAAATTSENDGPIEDVGDSGALGAGGGNGGGGAGGGMNVDVNTRSGVDAGGTDGPAAEGGGDPSCGATNEGACAESLADASTSAGLHFAGGAFAPRVTTTWMCCWVFATATWTFGDGICKVGGCDGPTGPTGPTACDIAFVFGSKPGGGALTLTTTIDGGAFTAGIGCPARGCPNGHTGGGGVCCRASGGAPCGARSSIARTAFGGRPIAGGTHGIGCDGVDQTGDSAAGARGCCTCGTMTICARGCGSECPSFGGGGAAAAAGPCCGCFGGGGGG